MNLARLGAPLPAPKPGRAGRTALVGVSSGPVSEPKPDGVSSRPVSELKPDDPSAAAWLERPRPSRRPSASGLHLRSSL
jgi:hypothetical protein